MHHEATRMTLGDTLLIPRIVQIHRQFTAGFDGELRFEPYISQVVRFGTTAMRLLCSLRQIDGCNGDIL